MSSKISIAFTKSKDPREELSCWCVRRSHWQDDEQDSWISQHVAVCHFGTDDDVIVRLLTVGRHCALYVFQQLVCCQDVSSQLHLHMHAHHPSDTRTLETAQQQVVR